MSVRKDVKEIKQMLIGMTKDYNVVAKKAKKYDEQCNLLKHVKFKVKSADIRFNEQTFAYSVVVTYDLPAVQVDFEVGGEQMTNDRFRAINLLDLVSSEDMQKVKEKLIDAQNKTKGV